MQAIWYGDRRDRVKWGALVHWAKAHRLSCIAQVAFYQNNLDARLQTKEGEKRINSNVWQHFSDLQRSTSMAPKIGIAVSVLDRPFDPEQRNNYTQKIIADLEAIKKRPRLVFLDPDTGIEPLRSRAKPKHVMVSEIEQIWNSLERGEWLAVYQHFDRRPEWLDRKGAQLMEGCRYGRLNVITGTGIAADVAIFGVCKSRKAA